MGTNHYGDSFGQKAKPGPSIFQKVLNYGVGAAKVGLGIAEGLYGGNPAGFISAAGTFGNMVNDKMDGRL